MNKLNPKALPNDRALAQGLRENLKSSIFTD
jgi:hypothetical protein